MSYRIAPVDIDFAGWTEVEAGEHNAWGAIDADGGLRAWALTRVRLQRLIDGNDEKEHGTNA